LKELVQAGFAVAEFAEDSRALEEVYFARVKADDADQPGDQP